MNRVRTAASLLIFALVAFFATPGFSAPPQRPFSGRGVLVITPFVAERRAELDSIPLYREPGVGRITEFAAAVLPRIALPAGSPPDAFVVAVLEKRGNWLKVAYDEAGRVGWLERARWWDYRAWDEFLPGETVTLVKGLKPGLYRPAISPTDEAERGEPVSSQTPIRVMEVNGDWFRAALPSGATGWLRWRDGDGRLLVSLGGLVASQNH